jgi:hypothetical protein
MSVDIVQSMNRIKTLREFSIEVDVPEGMKLAGVVPYDVNINANKGIFKVYASSYDEAKQKVDEFLKK